MKWTGVICVVIALAVGFGLGRATRPQALEGELGSVDSFQRSLEETDWLTRSYLFSSFLMGLNPDNLPEALEVLEPHLQWLNTDEFRLFMMAWARFDPSGAFEQAQAWPVEVRRKGGAAAMYAWGSYSPLPAVRELAEVEDSELQIFWGGRLLAGWVHGEYRDSANDYIAAFPNGPTQRKYLETLAWEIAKQGPDAVRQWAESVAEDPLEFKKAVFLKAANSLAGVDAPSTARWLEDHIYRDYVDNALISVAGVWALSDGTAAMSWLTRLPADTKRGAAIRACYRVWYNHSPKDAQRWLISASPARAVNPAVRFMVDQTKEEQPQISKEWVARLKGKP